MLYDKIKEDYRNCENGIRLEYLKLILSLKEKISIRIMIFFQHSCLFDFIWNPNKTTPKVFQDFHPFLNTSFLSYLRHSSPLHSINNYFVISFESLPPVKWGNSLKHFNISWSVDLRFYLSCLTQSKIYRMIW